MSSIDRQMTDLSDIGFPLYDIIIHFLLLVHKTDLLLAPFIQNTAITGTKKLNVGQTSNKNTVLIKEITCYLEQNVLPKRIYCILVACFFR